MRVRNSGCASGARSGALRKKIGEEYEGPEKLAEEGPKAQGSGRLGVIAALAMDAEQRDSIHVVGRPAQDRQGGAGEDGRKASSTVQRSLGVPCWQDERAC